MTPSELSELVSLAGDGPIHIHAAEQIKEVEDCVASLGARPVRWLLDHTGVDARWCIVHATHMERKRTRSRPLGRGRRACPITEANLGDGDFNATDYIRAGGRYGVGSDSNVSVGVAPELRQLEYAQRMRERARNVYAPPGASSGRTMLEAIWSGGAQAVRRNSGKLAPAAAADILTFRADHPTFAGKSDDQVLDAWIFSAGDPRVDFVWSGGLKVVAGGRHVFKDEIAERFAEEQCANSVTSRRLERANAAHRRPPSSSIWTSRSAGSS